MAASALGDLAHEAGTNCHVARRVHPARGVDDDEVVRGFGLRGAQELGRAGVLGVAASVREAQLPLVGHVVVGTAVGDHDNAALGVRQDVDRAGEERTRQARRCLDGVGEREPGRRSGDAGDAPRDAVREIHVVARAEVRGAEQMVDGSVGERRERDRSTGAREERALERIDHCDAPVAKALDRQPEQERGHDPDQDQPPRRRRRGGDGEERERPHQHGADEHGDGDDLRGHPPREQTDEHHHARRADRPTPR